VRSLRGAYQVVELPADLSASVREFSRGEGATPFMTLLAAFKALLHRYTGQTDIVVGTDVANRNRVETEGLIGFFINHVVLRTDLSGDPSFRELVGRVRRVSLDGFAHEDMPFDLLVKELNHKRDLGYTPLFQVLFVVQNAPSPELRLPGLTLGMIEADNGTTKFDLALFVTEAGERLRLVWKYNPDLFEGATVTRMARQFEALLAGALTQPGDALGAFVERINETERQQAMNIQERHQSKLKKLGSTRRKAIRVGEARLVETAPLDPANPLPLVISPLTSDLDPFEWAAHNRDLVREKLRHHGGLLFRGFELGSAADFERFAGSLCPELFGEYGDLPREGATTKVYGATPYPADQPILYHNESSHLDRWPMKIFFFCIQPPLTGGETPIVDCRRVLELLDPELRRRMTEKGLVYVRNFAPGLDVSWENFYRTADRAEVERKCREACTEFEWVGEQGLRTRQRRAAVGRHPLTGEEVFFNQVQLHHSSSLAREVRQSLLKVFGEEGLPRNVVYGDGTPISDEEMAAVDRAYEASAVLFPWRRGDVLMLDNMMVAHGRKAYTGERKIVVTMGEIVQEAEVQARAAEALASGSPREADAEEATASAVGVG
jgi:alpha-ketoglutarate-dependent taurine dioxygenase